MSSSLLRIFKLGSKLLDLITDGRLRSTLDHANKLVFNRISGLSSNEPRNVCLAASGAFHHHYVWLLISRRLIEIVPLVVNF